MPGKSVAGKILFSNLLLLFSRAAFRLDNIVDKALAILIEAKVIAGRPAWRQTGEA